MAKMTYEQAVKEAEHPFFEKDALEALALLDLYIDETSRYYAKALRKFLKPKRRRRSPQPEQTELFKR